MIKKKLRFAGMLVIVLVALALPPLYHLYHKRQFDQNRLGEINARLMITQNLDRQNNQMQTINEKIKHTKEDSSKSSIDDQPRKEEKYYVVQKGDNLSRISSTTKITIQELKVIN